MLGEGTIDSLRMEGTDMDAFGYAGRILRVDLASGKIEKEPLDLDLAREFIGGCGLNFVLTERLLQPGTDPLSPENPIVIGAGPLVGSPVPGAGKLAATTKFALAADAEGRRHVVASGISGSRRFGAMLKRAGYDHLVITGRADTPVLIRIDDDDVQIVEADNLWGKRDAYETVDVLRQDWGECGVVSIGAAGENQVKFSMALTDKKSTMGRNGFGAVMGSKNLKAVCARGTRPVRARDPERLKAALVPLMQALKGDPTVALYHEVGLHAEWWHYKHSLNPGLWPKSRWEELYGMEKCREAVEKTEGCIGCGFRCKVVQRVPDGPWAGARTETSHFLHSASIGQILGIEDWRSMVKLIDVCNRSGACAVSSAGLLLMAALCFEMGILTEKQTGGVRPKQGDIQGYLDLLEKIIRREDVGDVFAEGLLVAGKNIGLDMHDFAGIIKGSPCIHDPRDDHMDPRRFHQMVNPRGGDHSQCDWTISKPKLPLEKIRAAFLMTGASPEDADRVFSAKDYNCGRITRHVQDSGMVFDSMGTCLMYPMTGMPLQVSTLAEMYSAATGLEVSPAELKRAGERANNLHKILNTREGFTRKDDEPPRVWLTPKSTPDGDNVLMDYYGRRQLDEDDLKTMLDDYYDERGWDVKEGRPTPGKLEELGLVEYVRERDFAK